MEMIRYLWSHLRGDGLLMDVDTEKMIVTAVEMDKSISSEQLSLAMHILKYGVESVPTGRASPPAELARKMSQKVGAKPYLRRHEAAKYLGCCVRQIDQMKHDGDLPFYKIGPRLIVFTVQDLDSLMKSRRIDVSEMPE